MPDIDSRLLTQAAYARHRGCSRQAVLQAVAAQRITTFGPDKLIDPELADAQWQRNTRARAQASDPAAGESPPSDGAAAGTYRDWRTRREAAEAQAAELRLRQQAGELVSAADVGAELARVFVTFREAMLQIPCRLAAVLAAEADQAKVHEALDTEIRGALLHLKERI